MCVAAACRVDVLPIVECRTCCVATAPRNMWYMFIWHIASLQAVMSILQYDRPRALPRARRSLCTCIGHSVLTTAYMGVSPQWINVPVIRSEAIAYGHVMLWIRCHCALRRTATGTGLVQTLSNYAAIATHHRNSQPCPL